MAQGLPAHSRSPWPTCSACSSLRTCSSAVDVATAAATAATAEALVGCSRPLPAGRASASHGGTGSCSGRITTPWGPGCRLQGAGAGCRVQPRVQGAGCRTAGCRTAGLRVQGAKCRGSGLKNPGLKQQAKVSKQHQPNHQLATHSATQPPSHPPSPVPTGSMPPSPCSRPRGYGVNRPAPSPGGAA